MTQPQHDDTLLHRYHDGELSPEEAASLETALAEDGTSQAKLDALEELGSLLRGHASAIEAPDADDLFAAIENEIESEVDSGSERQAQQEPTVGPALRVISGGAKPAAKPQHAPGFMILALAAAALLAFWFLPGSDSGSEGETVAVQNESPEANVDEESSLVLIDTAPSGSEVLAVDFGQNTGTSFTVEGEVGQPVAVLWIMDEETSVQ